MADFYCDHGAYGAANRLALDTPAWGVPQEGDGTALAASTAASVASVVLAGQPTSSQVLQVCGVTLTAGTTFSIGASVDATCNNIATAINASTTGINSGVAAGGWALQRFVYARGPASGAPAATVEIMMRVGSANLNAHASHQVVSTFTPTPTINQFAGGAGGCFGYFLNEAAVGSLVAGQYGALIGYVMFVGGAAGGQATTIHDTLYVRTGTNKTIAPNFSSNTSSGRGAVLQARCVFDTNTKWTTDAADGTLTFAPTFVGAPVYTLTLTGSGTGASTASAVYQCLRRGNFKIAVPVTSGRLDLQVAKDQTSTTLDGVALHDNNSSGTAVLNLLATSQSAGIANVTYLNCDYVRSVSQTTLPNLATLMPTNSGMRVKFDGCTFTYNISGVSDPGALFGYGVGLNNLSPHAITFANCRFIANGYSGGLTMFPAGQPTWVNTHATTYDIRFENCTGLRMPTAFAGLLSTTTHADQDAHSIYINLGNEGFRHENARGVADWLPADNPPYLSAKLPDGATDWSLRCLWAATGILTPAIPYSAPALRVYHRLATATRTIGVELLVSDALTFTDRMLRLTVKYVDNTGTPRVETTQTVASSAATWSAMTGKSAKKMTLTTANQVATNTEITVTLDFIAAPSSGSNESVYVNPEPSIA